MAQEREGREPTAKQMLRLLGKKGTVWSSLRDYLADYYPQCVPVFSAEGKGEEHTVRYRKSGKTLVTLELAAESLIVVVILGKKEVAKTEPFEKKLNKKVRDLFRNTDQLHDGRWLWIRPSSKADIESIKLLLSVKRRPKGRVG